jgi:hypothetical protein
MAYLLNRKTFRDSGGNLRRPWGYADGKDWTEIKYALSFDGSDDEIEQRDVLSAFYGSSYTGGLTASAWIKITTDQKYNAVFDTPSRQINLLIGTNGSDCFYGIGGSARGFSPSENFTVDTWQHVSIRSDGNSASIFKDGNVVAENLSVGSTFTETLSMGKNTSGGGNDFPGVMSDIRLWDVALTQTQIQDNMNKRLTGNEPDLIAYYKLDEGEGSIATDSAGNNDGTINGATWVEDTPF